MKGKISFTMEASPLPTANDYNLIYVYMKQAWLYDELSTVILKPGIVIFVTLNFEVKVL